MSADIKNATPRPWRIFEQEIADKEQARRELAELVDGTPDFQPVMVYITDDNYDLAPAVTGCGARSVANAALIVKAVNAYDDMLAALRHVLEYGDLIGADKEMIRAAIANAERAK